jgi:hypothetical protein
MVDMPACCPHPMYSIQYGADLCSRLTACCPRPRYYAEVFPASGSKDVAVLDICSSWVSHYPQGYTAGRVAGGRMRAAPAAAQLLGSSAS